VVTPSAHASPSAPAPVPAPSTPATAEGAIAFVKAYFAELSHGLVTGDSQTLSGYSKASCPCRKQVTEIAVNSRAHEHWTTPVRYIDSIAVTAISPGHAEVLAKSHWLSAQLVDAQGHPIDVDPGHSAREKFVLDRRGAVWEISVVYGEYEVTK
jgi:hypothetical protein